MNSILFLFLILACGLSTCINTDSFACGAKGHELDIKNIKTSETDVVETRDNGVHCATYTPSDDTFFKAVKDGEIEIWRGGRKEKCSTVRFYSVQSTRLLTMHVYTTKFFTFMRFKFEVDKWKPIDCLEFKARLRIIKEKGRRGPDTRARFYGLGGSEEEDEEENKEVEECTRL